MVEKLGAVRRNLRSLTTSPDMDSVKLSGLQRSHFKTLLDVHEMIVMSSCCFYSRAVG